MMKQRQSNLEMLRIIAMMMIITLHYFSADRQPASGSENEIVYYVYESLAICGVNVFVLLTGYFSLNQNSIRVRKITNLLIDVAFWNCVGFMLCVWAGWRSFEVKPLVRSMFPIVFGGRWFVKAYIILLLLIPFINRILVSITRKSYQSLLFVMLFLFSIWPSFFPNPPFDDYGYSFIHFISLYVIAGYLRLHVKIFPDKWLCLLGYLLSFGIVLMSKVFEQGYSWAYNYPFVILEALFLFMLFAQLDLKSAAINRFAACAFGVYLIHTNAFFSEIGYERVCGAAKVINGNCLLFISSVPLSTLFFYVAGTGLEMIKRQIFRVAIDPLLDAVPVLNKSIKVEGIENT